MSGDALGAAGTVGIAIASADANGCQGLLRAESSSGMRCTRVADLSGTGFGSAMTADTPRGGRDGCEVKGAWWGGCKGWGAQEQEALRNASHSRRECPLLCKAWRSTSCQVRTGFGHAIIMPMQNAAQQDQHSTQHSTAQFPSPIGQHLHCGYAARISRTALDA